VNEIKDIKYPGFGGLNYDDDNYTMPENDYRFAYNIVSNEDGNQRLIVGSRGNELKTTSLPAGTNKVIAFKEDVENNAGIYFIYNGSANHSIYRYNANGTFTVILNGAQNNGLGSTVGVILNFGANDTLDVDVVGDGVATKDGEGQLLLWSGGENPPRKINITKAINFTAGTGTPAYTQITNIKINQVKQPPLIAPILTYQDDPDFNANNLRGVIYQVAIRYIYDDNEKSVKGPVSKIQIPQQEEFPNGLSVGNTYKNNLIKITYYTYVDTVVGVDILIRKADVGSGVSGDWTLYDSVKIASSGIHTYYFYGDKIPYSLDQDDINRNYDAIGQIVRRQCLINNSRIVHGDITEGYENVNLNVVLTGLHAARSDADDALGFMFRGTTAAIGQKTILHIYNYGSTVPGTVWAMTTHNHGYATGDYIQITGTTDYNGSYYITVIDNNEFYFTATYVSDQSGTAQAEKVVMNFPFTADTDVNIGLVVKVGDTYYSYSLNNTEGKTKTEISTYFRNAINDEDVATFSATAYGENFRISQDDEDEIIAYMNILASANKYKTWCDGAIHYFGIVYYDEHGGRCGYANVSDESNIYIPSVQMQTHSGDNRFTNGIQWQIKHIPPIWAYKYQWVYGKSSVLWKTPYVINFNDEISEESETEYFKIVISDAVVRINGYLNNSNLPAYTFEKGDRLRVVGYYYLVEALENFPSTKKLVHYIHPFTNDDSIDVEVLSQDEDGDIYVSSLKNFDEFYGVYKERTALMYLLIEIYRPSRFEEEERYYFEFGECFSVGNPGTANRYHGAGTSGYGVTSQAQSYSDPTGTPAKGVFNDGDYYFQSILWDKQEDIKINIVLPANLPSISMFYDSQGTSMGRFHTVNLSAVQKRYNKIRYGGKYIDESNLNFLSKFEFDDEKALDDRYGRICKMIQRGGVLRIFQEHKVTSFNLDSTTSTDADGNVIVTYADQIVSNGIQSVEDYGSKHPKTFIKNNNYIYYFDFNHFCVVRDALNGAENISRYKMTKFFKDKVNQIISLGEDIFDIIAGYDESTETYYITFKQKTPNVVYLSNYSNTVLGTIKGFTYPIQHQLVTGDRIRIFNSNYYNGSYEIIKIDDYNFYFYNTFIATETSYYDRSETLSFYELSNQWKSFYGFAPEFYGKIGSKFVSFLAGSLYLHNSTAVNRTTFMGMKFKAEIDLVFNKNPQDIKIYNSIEIHSNKGWDAGNIDSIKIEASEKYPNGMKSRLKKGYFKNIEGVYYADFLRDILSSGIAKINNLLNGRPLRGKTIRIRLTNDDNDKVILFSVVANSQFSK